MCKGSTSRPVKDRRQNPYASGQSGHEAFIGEIAKAAISRLPPDEREKCKLRIVYGSGGGMTGVRGVTFYGKWSNGEPEPIDLVEICAFGEESLLQIAGTTIHEIAHVLAGHGAAHGKDWKAACALLGLRCAKAAGMRYSHAALSPAIREIVWFHEFADGRPATGGMVFGLPIVLTKPRPCSQGIGSRGGKSRGKGSGSRQRKFVCQCEPPVIVRAARDELNATCNDCSANFERA